MSSAALPSDTSRPDAGDRRLWLGYAGLCLLCWTLYAIAGTEWLRGSWRAWEAVYEATWNLVPPMLLGMLVLPWVRLLQRRAGSTPARLAAHGLAALSFAALWQLVDYALARGLFGRDHAAATFEQRVLWRSAWGVLVYIALVLGFGGALHARRAHRAAVAAAQAEAALVRAELAAISGKLKPHFLFNTLNSIVLLTRKDPQAAERALLSFSNMLRYLLDAKRGAAERVPLHAELDFLRDYVELESVRLGARLRVAWDVDAEAEDDEIPPLTLQPLVENAIVHGLGPCIHGGTVRIECRRLAAGQGLWLQVADDGAGCAWPPAEMPARAGRIGLAALRRRFELDYGGRARFDVQAAPGAGFRVEIVIPASESAA
jgi:signal transduction histidine kinase